MQQEAKVRRSQNAPSFGGKRVQTVRPVTRASGAEESAGRSERVRLVGTSRTFQGQWFLDTSWKVLVAVQHDMTIGIPYTSSHKGVVFSPIQ